MTTEEVPTTTVVPNVAETPTTTVKTPNIPLPKTGEEESSWFVIMGILMFVGVSIYIPYKDRNV